MEALVAERVAALCAEEVLGMPGLVQGSHTFLERGEIVRGAQVRESWLILSKPNTEEVKTLE